MNKRLKKIVIAIVIVLIAAACAFALFRFYQTTSDDKLQQAAEKALKFINANFLSDGNTASLVSVAEENGVLKVILGIGDSEYTSYISKDGKLFFPEGYAMKEEESGETAKSDVPDVKLFVMSYCPYGLQAQKMFLPVYDLLKDKANMEISFVNYVMHGKSEIDENLNQYCVQKEEKDKFSSYLSCFVKSGDSEACFATAGVDTVKIDSCIAETDEEFSVYSLYDDQSTWMGGTYPQFNIDADLNEQYGVQGSPTIVINDEVVQINPRSPENFKNIVCQAFNNAPEECSQVLSSDVPSTGIGEGSSSTSGGTCE
jgi:hypothetical protein